VGLGVVRVPQLGLVPASTASEPSVGALAIAVGRTWSGAVMATVTNVAVVGGPLRTGPARQVDRVIRIAQSPHGALTGGALADAEGRLLGVITGSEIRGTTVVIPSLLAFEAAHQVARRGGTRQGYLGIGSMPVTLPARQREGNEAAHGLVVLSVASDSPAEAAGVLVGDILLQFGDDRVSDAESLLTLLRGDHIGRAVPLTVLRGVKRQEIAVTVGERPRRDR
jgi:S1-C subfamily serine protease